MAQPLETDLDLGNGSENPVFTCDLGMKTGDFRGSIAAIFQARIALRKLLNL
jgi:hypothetical protein